MKKIVLSFFMILCIIITLSACSENTTQPEITLENIADMSKLYEDDTVILTKNDIAVWLVRMIKYFENNNYDLSYFDNEVRKELLGEAISFNILKGSSDEHIDDEKFSTKEEAFSMIERAFLLEPQVDIGALSLYQDFSQVSKWATQSVSEVVTVISQSDNAYLLDNGICPQSCISQEEMLQILPPIIVSKDNYVSHMGIWDKILRNLKHIWHIYALMGGTLIFLLTIMWKLLRTLHIKHKIKKEIIYIGDMSCGKTELSKVLCDPAKPRRKIPYSPTRAVNKTESVIVKDASGYTVFYGIADDIPGGSNDALLNILSNNKLINHRKIIILLLAHNKSDSDSNIDNSYITEQYNRLDKVYMPAIKRFGKRINKLIVFVNKCDTLPPEFSNDWGKTQETIYKKHFDLLHEDLPQNIKIQVCFGSATKRKNIDKLQRLLI